MPERHTLALRRLLRLHLMHAEKLRLLEVRALAEFDSFLASTISWSRPELSCDQKFGVAVESAKRLFFDNWRFRAISPAERVTLCRVVRVNELKYSLNSTSRKSSAILAALLQDFDDLVPKLSLNASTSSAVNEFSAVQTVLLGIRAEFLGAKLSPYETLASAVHGPGSCWVASEPFVNAGMSSRAQFWRDRLGLYHLPQGGTLGDQLVRLTFSAKLSNHPCPPNFQDFDAVRAAMPDEIWLVRPSVGDVPNPRFVQATSRDTSLLAAATGATIDLSTQEYDEGEDELVMLHGRDARLQWIDLELLDGLPQRHFRDDDHETFVNLIESRHMALSK